MSDIYTEYTRIKHELAAAQAECAELRNAMLKESIRTGEIEKENAKLREERDEYKRIATLLNPKAWGENTLDALQAENAKLREENAATVSAAQDATAYAGGVEGDYLRLRDSMQSFHIKEDTGLREIKTMAEAREVLQVIVDKRNKVTAAVNALLVAIECTPDVPHIHKATAAVREAMESGK